MISRFKYYILAIFLILTISLSFFLLSQNTKKSFLLLDSEDNKFKISLDLNKADKKNLIELLNKLNISNSLIDGFSFDLDSTSSATLAFLTPIKSDFNVNSNTVSFSGETSHSLISTKNEISAINIPQSSNLTLLTQNKIEFIFANNSLKKEFKIWLENTFPKEIPGYLLVFGKNADYAIITLDQGSDFSMLSDIFEQEQLEESYKVETQNEIIYHLINTIANENKQSQTLTLFKIDKWQVISSSRDTAFEVANSIKSADRSISLPWNNIGKNSNFALYYQNLQDVQLSQNFINLLFETDNFSQFSPQNLEQKLQKVKTLHFVLMEDEFSGLIEFK